jgi:hypothetical protein
MNGSLRTLTEVYIAAPQLPQSWLQYMIQQKVVHDVFCVVPAFGFEGLAFGARRAKQRSENRSPLDLPKELFMTTGDHLDKETSVTVKTSEDGFEAKAKSRVVSGVDRLLGNLTEVGNVYLEGRTTSKRSRIEAEKLVMQAAAASLTATLVDDKELAIQILNSGFSQMARRHENKAEVINAAAEELKLLPPTKEQGNTGPEQLSEDFLNKFERYSEDAKAEEVRQKWAKVLAAEVKSPGRFDAKVMRTLDEIDNQTAEWFAKVAKYRIGLDIPKIFCTPEHHIANALQESGLMHNLFPGTIRFGQSTKDSGGKELSIITFGGIAFTFDNADLKAAVATAKIPDLVVWDNDKDQISIPILSLTKTGKALLEILDDRSIENSRELLRNLRDFRADANMLLLSSDGMNWVSAAE